MKCETYGIFKSIFNLRVHYCAPNLFCPFDHLLQVAEYISYLFIFFDFKSDMMRLYNEQATVVYTYFSKEVPVCGKSDILF